MACPAHRNRDTQQGTVVLGTITVSSYELHDRKGSEPNTRQLLPHRRHACVPPFLRPLFRLPGGRLFGGISKYIVSYDARVASKWRHWLDREAWTQNAETFRCKRKENDYKHCCTFHVSGFYRMNHPLARKF